MREETLKLRAIIKEAQKKAEWTRPTVVGARAKTCECKPGPYTYDTTPSYCEVCDDSGYIKECDDC